MLPLRVLLLGLVGAGKSHLARICAARAGGIVLPFAKDVYALAENVLGRSVDKSRPGDRELLKLIGTSWGREGTLSDIGLKAQLDRLWGRVAGYADIWVDGFERHVGMCPDTPIFNDDTRFPNELMRAVHELGFAPFFVLCSPETRLGRLRIRGEMAQCGNTPPHESEAMNTLLAQAVLTRPFIPVIWNDAHVAQPPLPWVMTAEDFCANITQPRHVIDWCEQYVFLNDLHELVRGKKDATLSRCADDKIKR